MLVVPLRSFADAKSRLNDALTEMQRREFVEKCAARIFNAADQCPDISSLYVVTADDEVSSYVAGFGIASVVSPHGLNKALNDFRDTHRDEHIVVCHSDVAMIRDFMPVTQSLESHDVVLAPDRHRTGTNIVGIRSEVAFEYQFGENSFQRHFMSCISQRKSMFITHDPQYGCDIDTPEDLLLLTSIHNKKDRAYARSLLRRSKN